MSTVHILTTAETRNPIGSLAPPDMIVAIGFGQANITHDGQPLFDGEAESTHHYDRRLAHFTEPPSYVWRKSERPEELRTLRVTHGRWLTLARVDRYLEHRARSGAPLTGRIECTISGPMWGGTWLREGPGRWVCTEAGMGFA